MKQNKLGTFDLTQIAGGPLGNFAQQAGHGHSALQLLVAMTPMINSHGARVLIVLLFITRLSPKP